MQNTESFLLNRSDLSSEYSPTLKETRQRRPPVDLADRRRWVVWEYDGDTKPPAVVGRETWTRSNWQRLPNWTTFDIACEYANERDRADGVGFVLTAEGPFVGIDLDDVRDPETGRVHDGVRELLAAVDSYTEVSPSETGFKAIARGQWPLSSNHYNLAKIADDPDWSGAETPTLEVYDCGQYFTVTGRYVVGTPHAVTDSSDVLGLLADTLGKDDDSEADDGDAEMDELVAFRGRMADRLREARAESETVDRLCTWAQTDGAKGQTPYDDRSGNERYLTWLLAYWFENDRSAVKRVLNHLSPPKWSKREDDSYRESILDTVDRQPDKYERNRPESSPSRELTYIAYHFVNSCGPVTTAEIAEYADYSPRQTRKALGRLDDAGFVQYEREGRSGQWRAIEDDPEPWIEAEFNSIEKRDEYLKKENLRKFGKDSRE